MAATRRRAGHGRAFWLLVVATAVFMSVEPGLFLVVLALGLSFVTVIWVVLLARFVLLDLSARLRMVRAAPPREGPLVQ